MESIVKLLDLNYGTIGNDYHLENGKVGDYTVFYDYQNIGRGIEVSIQKGFVGICTLLPATIRDIDMTYEIVGKICDYLKTDKFYKNDVKYKMSDIDTLKEEDFNTTKLALEDNYRKVGLGVMNNLCLFCAKQMVFLAKDEVYQFEDSVEKFSSFLHDIQNNKCFKPVKKTYVRADNSKFTIYYVYEDELTLMLKNPNIMKLNDEVKDIYVCIPDMNLIKYDDFINNVKTEKLDDGFVKVVLESQDIELLLKDFAIDSADNSSISREDCIYLGKPLESAFRHLDKFYDLPLSIDRINAYNHLAAFLKCAYDNGWIDDIMYKVEPDLDNVMKDIYKIREMLDTNKYIDRSLRLNMFKEEYRDFIYHYCSREFHLYPPDVDDYTLSVMGEEEYNSPKYYDEAYLFLTYDLKYCDDLGKYIIKAYKKYLKDEKVK